MQAIERIRTALEHLKDVPSSLKTGLGIDEYRAACRPVSMSEVLAHIDKLVAENERLRKDAERYRWLAKYLVSDDESHDDAIVAATTVAELDCVIDAAMKGTP